MGDHTYYLAQEKAAERVPSLSKKRKHEEAKRRRDRRRQRTRINIGVAFHRWKLLMNDKCFQSDAEVACFLLDRWRELRDKLEPQKEVHLACVLSDSYEKISSISLSCTCMQKPPAPSSLGHVSASESFEEMDVTIDEDECNSNDRISDLDDDMENITETTELRSAGADNSCDEEVYVPLMPQRSTASEFLLECEEEELEPWQKRTSQVRVKEEDDVGELTVDCKPEPSPLQIDAVNSSPPVLKTESPQPDVFNNQEFTAASPQLTSNTEFTGSLGTQRPPGNSFAIVPAGHQHIFQNVATATVTPEVQQISNNPVSLPCVQGQHREPLCDHLQERICDVTMDLKLEQRANIEHCVRLGKSARETLKMLKKAYGNEAMSRARCFEWHSRFKRGRTSLEDNERSGRPSTSTTPENVQEIERLVRQNRRITIKEIADTVNVSFGTVHTILTSNLNMHRIAAKLMPRVLTPEQKQHRVEVCEDLYQQAQNDPTFMLRIITGGESWIYRYDPESKQQSLQRTGQQSPGMKKVYQVRRVTKSLLIVFFDIRGVVHHEFIPQGETVNAEFYCTVLKRLREDIQRKRPGLWRDGNWVLHHDNAPAHSALRTREFFGCTNTIVAPHPSYSPDLAPCDFFLFPKLKSKLKGHRLDTVEEIQNESQVVLDSLTEREFQEAFQAWQERWEQCITAQGDYFEGDGSQIRQAETQSLYSTLRKQSLSQHPSLRSTMSELFMECVEEELEPWQKQVPEVQLIEDDDDEPIFVGVLSNNQKDGKPNPPPPQRNTAGKPEIKHPGPQPVIGPSPIMLPLNIAGNAVRTAAPTLTTVSPQPVIVNNQGFIVTSPQLANSSEFIASLGTQYPPGTSFAIVPAGQQQLFQRVSPATVIPGAVHRPQVQQIRNNIVTLSNVQSPAVYSTQSAQLQPNLTNTQSLQIFSGANRAQSTVKRALLPQKTDCVVKRAKLDLVPAKVTVKVENGILKKKCSKCQEEFLTPEALNSHIINCSTKVESTTPSSLNPSPNKRIMLVSDFYYGHFEGDGYKEVQKTNTTFKCQSCLKVLKNNIRFMNHMKHHLELEKQNSESWESHTTCQHCYRQYMTPFQLQCHIESAHSPIESSTNCKICELAFESEQVLLEHMKDNHKPGEMPYVCQVCNYRSSFFSDVETHFRTAHENTKDLLCPFCLKVLRSSHMYMQHYMKHQKKGIHRCGKCRLNFLTYKEKLEHRTHVHKTFRKPKALEGLPPGTKVTIRASLTGKTPVLPTSPDRSGFTVTPETLSFSQQTRSPVCVSKAKLNISGAGKAKMNQSKKQDGRTTKHNLALRNLRVNGGCYTCIECNAQVDNFFSHFPMVSNCGACKYRTSCKVSIGNHMIRFHSTITKNRFLKMDHKKNASTLKFTLVCLNCDLLVDASGGDLMTKHLTDRPNHICKVIQEKADIKAKDRVHLVLGQPAKVLYLLTSAPAQRPKDTDLKLVESVTSGSVTVATVDQPDSKPMLPAGDQEKGSTDTSVNEGSFKGELKQSLLPAPSSACTSDGVLDLGAESVVKSDSPDVAEQLSATEIVPENVTEEQQTKPE
ncbi:zinc finger protein 280D [Lates calcarifer]|uniref:Zinc finger protein 280D n=2 Tax=Lates calcarifer TaxID=8187 RepID=A0AAJ8DXC9_LATCA|nr:zinc finger protein 280D [Lates calcarifer]